MAQIGKYFVPTHHKSKKQQTINLTTAKFRQLDSTSNLISYFSNKAAFQHALTNTAKTLQALTAPISPMLFRSIAQCIKINL
jgi:hypothetical protein